MPSSAIEMAPQGQEDDKTERQVSDGSAPPLPPVAFLPVGMEIWRSSQTPLFIELICAAPSAPGRWQRVQWWLQGGTLYRCAGEAVARYPILPPRHTDSVAVLRGVASFDMRAWEPGRGWLNLPAHAQSQPASGIEIMIDVRRSEGPLWRYRRVVVLN